MRLRLAKMKQITQKLKYILASSAFLLVFSLTALSPSAYSQSLFNGAKSEACAGSQLTADSGPNCSGDDKTALSETIEAAINLVSIIVGVIAVIMIIIGGIRFVLSNGDSAKVTTARNTIIYALIGLILVAFAQVIVKFVLSRV